MESFTLFDGTAIPKIGFGTYQMRSEDPVMAAVEAGFRFFDTASLYGTEQMLGNALRATGIPRDKFIIGTKLWIDETDDPAAALERSLRRLGTDYADIYMIHWPRKTGSFDENWKETDLQTYSVLERLADEGKIRYIGLSNFLPHHLKNILDNCRIHPAVDQLELHPGCSQEAAVAYCKENNVLPVAWSPFGRGDKNSAEGNMMISHLAQKYGRTPQQINLRFLIQKGIVPVPKATSAEHIRANMDVFDFELEWDEISMLSCMPQTAWLGEHPDTAIPTAVSNKNDI